jgi:hypothetical protein
VLGGAEKSKNLKTMKKECNCAWLLKSERDQDPKECIKNVCRGFGLSKTIRHAVGGGGRFYEDEMTCRTGITGQG